MLLFAVAISLFALLPASSANSFNGIPVQNTQITLQELLASHGLNNGQAVILLIAPQNRVSNQRVSAARTYQANNNQQFLVEAPAQSVQVNYKSQSIPLNVQHTHIPAPKPEIKLSKSEEEPHIIVHEIFRPVVQEVREIIQPYRRIVQEIRPVEEEIISSVATSKKQKTKPDNQA